MNILSVPYTLGATADFCSLYYAIAYVSNRSSHQCRITG